MASRPHLQQVWGQLGGACQVGGRLPSTPSCTGFNDPPPPLFAAPCAPLRVLLPPALCTSLQEKGARKEKPCNSQPFSVPPGKLDAGAWGSQGPSPLHGARNEWSTARLALLLCPHPPPPLIFLPPGKAIRNPNITINAQSILALSRGHRHTPYQGGNAQPKP